jgi:hypothetical protein
MQTQSLFKHTGIGKSGRDTLCSLSQSCVMCYEANPDGSMGDHKTAESVFDAMTATCHLRELLGQQTLSQVTCPPETSPLEM